MSCDAPASGAVSGLLTLLVTVDHEFFKTSRSGQTQTDFTESAVFEANEELLRSSIRRLDLCIYLSGFPAQRFSAPAHFSDAFGIFS
jgi:hypothetical protein